MDLLSVILSALGEAAVVFGKEDAAANINQDRCFAALSGECHKVAALGAEPGEEKRQIGQVIENFGVRIG